MLSRRRSALCYYVLISSRPESRKCIYCHLSFFIVSVGTNIGEVALWEVDSQDRITVDTFTIWDTKNCSLTLQVRVYAPEFFLDYIISYIIFVFLLLCFPKHKATISPYYVQESLANEFTALVNRVIWSPQGTLFGIYAFEFFSFSFSVMLYDYKSFQCPASDLSFVWRTKKRLNWFFLSLKQVKIKWRVFKRH